MKAIDPLLLEELGKETTTLCRLWVIEPIGSRPLTFTDHDTDIEVAGVVYRSDRSFQASAVQSALGGVSQNMEVTVLLDEPPQEGDDPNDKGITHYDLLRGKYDNAKVSLYICSYNNLVAIPLRLYYGQVGTVTLPTKLGGLISLVGNITRVTKIITETYQPYCRCDFGDSRCKFDLSKVTEQFTVTRVISPTQFVMDLRPNEGHYYDGTIVWRSGDNFDRSIEVQTNLADGRVVMFFRPAFPIKVGDIGTITRGCSKTYIQCQNEYQNLPNHRGEPFVPGDRYMG